METSASQRTPMLVLPSLPASYSNKPEYVNQYDIVVADDETAIARVIAEVLAEEGYSVRVFHDGASALLAITENPPLLVLLDIAMPVMRGDELLAKLRDAGYGDLPVILMSAGSRLADFLDKGATDIISKPFDIDQLIACVEAHTPQHQA